MFENVIPYFIQRAIKQALMEQVRLLSISTTEHSEYLDLVKELSEFALEMQKWLNGELEIKSPLEKFKKEAQKLEKRADEISDRLWKPNLLDIVSIFDYAYQEKARTNKTFEYQLKVHFDLQRQRLLDQVRGARLLANPSDRGDEVEKILLEYLQDNLDNDLMVVRGGHIFDMDNNRSNQMDIIIIPAKTLSMCPSDTPTGKVNVMVDQVIAVISVKSTLEKEDFKKAWKGIQSIPIYKDKDSDLPHFKGHPWPLGFIFGANSIPMKEIEETWDKMAKESIRHPVQMVISLQEGFCMSRSATWPLIGFDKEDLSTGYSKDRTQIGHGLGLGWLLLAINARAAAIARKPLHLFNKHHKLLSNAGLLAGCGSPEPRIFHLRTPSPMGKLKILKIPAKWITNKIYVCAVSINGKVLVNESVPVEHECWKIYTPYANRWFEPEISKIDEENSTCHLKEWIKNRDNSYLSRIVKYNYKNGEEIAP